ncbi:hypothetical protein [Amycolatopsis saalfeldensis]|uniref:Uncharacterized protein n=1 Tax=Amycolatopsis saalfeldensis TaxID=394193 RepID=A0A1H8YP18_9PSEU|nr:hypothetical protein [Amycolatopsis saalfeldensis]SEP53955.1 hypothetical protein SAMN04489732_13410 [Amycolatopsis saalfeldensis]
MNLNISKVLRLSLDELDTATGLAVRANSMRSAILGDEREIVLWTNREDVWPAEEDKRAAAAQAAAMNLVPPTPDEREMEFALIVSAQPHLDLDGLDEVPPQTRFDAAGQALQAAYTQAILKLVKLATSTDSS